MSKSEQNVRKIEVLLGNNITVATPTAFLAGHAAASLINKLVYDTKLANDHILHELEARYGEVMARYIYEKMP